MWGNNQPVIVFSAVFSTDAQIPTAKGTFVLAETPAATGPAARGDGPFWMMLVVRTDIYGNLRKLYLGITDKYHLDVTPRLELIDAVDADGDGRGDPRAHGHDRRRGHRCSPARAAPNFALRAIRQATLPGESRRAEARTDHAVRFA